jgi:TP901 family phage tail tape measure protein
MVTSVGRNMALVGAAIVGATGLVVKSFADTESAIAKMKFEMDSAMLKSVPDLENQMRELAESTGTAVNALSVGMAEALDAISDPVKAMMTLTEANKLAIASGSDLTATVHGITAVLSAYQMDASKAASITDYFAVLAKEGRGSVDEFADGIAKVAPYAAQTGVSLEDLGATISTMTRHGIDANTAMTIVRATILAFQNPTKEATELASKYGFEMSAAAIKAKGWGWALEQVTKLTDAEAEALLGNNRAKLAASIITDNLTEYQGQLAIQTERAGTAQKAYDEANQQLNIDLGKLSASFKNLLDTAIAPVVPAMKELVDNVAQAVQRFRDWAKEHPELLAMFVKWSIVLGPVLVGLGGLLTALPQLILGIKLAIGAIQGLLMLGLNPLGIALAALVVSLALVIGKWWEWKQAQDGAKQAVIDNARTIVNATEQQIGAFNKLIGSLKDVSQIDKERAGLLEKRLELLKKEAEVAVMNGATEKELEPIRMRHLALTKEQVVLQEELNGKYEQQLAVKEETVAAEGAETESKKILLDEIKAERVEVLQLTSEYRALNQKLAEGIVTKEEYSKAFGELVQKFTDMGIPMDQVLAKLDELDKSDPNIEVKLKIFGLEEIEDVKERIKRINQEIVLSQLDGDEKTRKSLEFSLQNEIEAINKKLKMAEFAHREKMLLLDAAYQHEQTLIIMSTEQDKAKQDTLLKQLEERIKKQRELEEERYKELQILYASEAEAHKQLTQSKLKDLEQQKDGYQKVGQVQQAVTQSAASVFGNTYQLGVPYQVSATGEKIPVGGEGQTTTVTTKVNPKVVSGFTEPSDWYKQNFPTLSGGGYFGSAQGGKAFVPETGLYKLHRGEEVTPGIKAEQKGGGVTIVNVFDEEIVPTIMAKYPNAIINPVLKSMMNSPVTKKVVRNAVRS